MLLLPLALFGQEGGINSGFVPGVPMKGDTLPLTKVTISGADSLFTTIKDVCSQEYTYAVDNTGTTTNEAATWTFTLSNGTSIVVDQVNQGSTSQWTPQMQQVGADLQTAADNAGIKWLVETRCILGPTNPNGCGGFAGPPSEVVGQALWDGGQRARYINIQICPGEPTPVSVLYESASRSRLMVTAGPVLGPVQEFRVKEKCTSNGVELSWFIKESATAYVPATAGQIPFCAAPCAGLSDSPPPEQGDCDFKVVEACDNNNSQLTSDFTQLITRIVPLCNGVPGTPNYYTEDNGALVDYTLVGQFVDCATGEIIPLPLAECEVDGIIELFSMEGVNGLLRNREWFDYAPAASPFPLTSDHGRGIRESFDFTTATTSDGTQNSLVINDSNNTASILDVQVVDGYILVEEPIQSRYNGGSEGYWAVELGQCCGSLELLNESGGFSPDREMTFTLPKGTHQIRIWNIDSGGSNSSANFSYSLDGGVTYISDNTPPGVSFSQSKPNEICKKIKSCANGVYTDLRGNTIDLDDCYECPISCDPVITSSTSSDTQLRTLRID